MLKKLFSNEWISVVEKTTDNGGKYVYSQSIWCNCEGIAILPYRFTANSRLEFLGRFEICPAHSDELELCSITGGMDKESESPVFTARRELIEESGYVVDNKNLVYLGTVRPSKSSDTTTHLFTVRLDKDFIKTDAVGDGTLGEEGSFCKWVSFDEITKAKDPLLHTIICRTNEMIFNEISEEMRSHSKDEQ